MALNRGRSCDTNYIYVVAGNKGLKDIKMLLFNDDMSAEDIVEEVNFVDVYPMQNPGDAPEISRLWANIDHSDSLYFTNESGLYKALVPEPVEPAK